MLNGALDEESVASLCGKLDLQNRALLLAQASTEELYDALQAAVAAARFLRDDATAVLIAADAGARFHSSIV